jgi:UDP-N-acetylglucosamine enolpyruvyl transferase
MMAPLPNPAFALAVTETSNRFARLLAVQPPHYPDRVTYVKWLDRLVAQIKAEGGTISVSGAGQRIKLHGFAASSAEGLAGAVRNWRAQVRQKLGQPSEGALT